MQNFDSWISAQERLPRDGDIVHVCCEDGTYLLAAYDEGWREPWEGPVDDVAYWCNLPELPAELAFLDASLNKGGMRSRSRRLPDRAYWRRLFVTYFIKSSYAQGGSWHPEKKGNEGGTRMQLGAQRRVRTPGRKH